MSLLDPSFVGDSYRKIKWVRDMQHRQLQQQQDQNHHADAQASDSNKPTESLLIAAGEDDDGGLALCESPATRNQSDSAPAARPFSPEKVSKALVTRNSTTTATTIQRVASLERQTSVLATRDSISLMHLQYQLQQLEMPPLASYEFSVSNRSRKQREMADTEANAASAESGAAIVSEQLTALVLMDEDADTAFTSIAIEHQDTSKPPSTSATPSNVSMRGNEENTPPPNRRPLFSSMREALESSGQVKEEPGGYVIKRHSGRQQQFRSGEGAARSKNRHAKQRPGKDTLAAAAPSPEDEADAAGYTVIRRRSSCDESSSSRAAASVTTSHSSAAGRRNPRASTPARAGKKPQQQRPRRDSMSALPSSTLRASGASPSPSSSVPPGFQPLRPPPGLTQAASGWVVKAAAPAERANKIEEPPVEALWPEMKSSGKTPSGWAATSEGGGLQAQAWPAPASTSRSAAAAQKEQEDADDDDLLARLGVTL